MNISSNEFYSSPITADKLWHFENNTLDSSKQIAEILNIRYNIANKILRILYKNNEIRATKKGKYTYYYR